MHRASQYLAVIIPFPTFGTVGVVCGVVFGLLVFGLFVFGVGLFVGFLVFFGLRALLRINRIELQRN